MTFDLVSGYHRHFELKHLNSDVSAERLSSTHLLHGVSHPVQINSCEPQGSSEDLNQAVYQRVPEC